MSEKETKTVKKTPVKEVKKKEVTQSSEGVGTGKKLSVNKEPRARFITDKKTESKAAAENNSESKTVAEKKSATKKPAVNEKKSAVKKTADIRAKDETAAKLKLTQTEHKQIEFAPINIGQTESVEQKEENSEPKTEKAVVKKRSTDLAKITEIKKEAAKTVPTAKKAKSGKKVVLYVCSEAFPFAGTGGLGEVAGSLPKAINETKDSSFEARIIMPLYESFPFEERKNLQFICHINVPLAWRNQYCGLFKYDYKGVVYYFVDNEYYFKRPNLYGYYDDGERFAFFSRAVTELIPHLDVKPDVLHCQDWQTALVPIYYKLYYMYREGFENVKTVFTIHNIEYQGNYSKSIIEDVFGIPVSEYRSIEHGGSINLMKGAIDYSDAVSTVSPTYAKEIMQPFYAHGLETVLLKNSFKLRGILNGVDVDSYNPQTNKALFKNYSVKTVADKYENKSELRKMLSLPDAPNTPVIAMISRLVTHKGLDLVRFAMNELLKKDVQIVILGKGDPDFENYFTYLQKTYDTKVSAIITFNKDLSHKIYAGADMFLMPSKSEPCGLSQMMACRYGTIPIVRATGGLRDSITDCGSGDSGNGFVFENYDAAEMLNAIERAVGLYKDYSDKWDALVLRAMNTDFSWSSSAKEYIKFYAELF